MLKLGTPLMNNPCPLQVSARHAVQGTFSDRGSPSRDTTDHQAVFTNWASSEAGPQMIEC
jgi:hypothetical protein